MTIRPADVKLALRSLRRAPAFAVTSVLILALGIGMAVAMYGVADAVLRRPLPVQGESRIILPHLRDARGVDLPLLEPDLKALRAESHTLSGIAAIAHQGAVALPLLDGEKPLLLRSAWVTGNYFEVLGARPALGRLFRAEEESDREPQVLVLSYDTWRRRFGGDTAVIGRALKSPYTLHSYAIIGVAPAGLDYPPGVEYWTPLVYSGGLNVVGRLAPGNAAEGARQEFAHLMRQQFSSLPGRAARSLASADVRTLSDGIVGDVRPVLRLLGVAVGLLLLLACLNVGMLQLLRVTGRERELAVRRTLGASAADIAGHLLIETLLVVATGGALGLALAGILTRALLRAAPAGLPRLDVIRQQPGWVWLGAAVTVAVAVAVSLLPTLGVFRRDLATTIRIDSRTGRATRGGRRVRRWFVASQVALAVLVLAGAGLLARSLANLQRIDPGYRPDHLSLLSVVRPIVGGDATAIFDALLEKVSPALKAVPGVTSVTAMSIKPFYGPQIFNGEWEAAGHPADAAAPVRIAWETGGAGYFTTLGIPILRGRGFEESDRKNSPKVAVVSVEAARILGLGADPLGQQIRGVGDTGADAWATVVGLVGDVHYRNLRETTPTIFFPASQLFFQGLMGVRTTGSLASMLPALQQAVHDADPSATIAVADAMDDLVAAQRAIPRFSTILFGGFGVVALLLASLGLYGMMASTVREGARDIGVRMALGATPGRVQMETVRGALAVTGAGVLAGIAGAVAGSRLVASLLFQVSPTDGLTLAGVSVLLLVVGLGAAFVPARRATLVDPAQVLKSE